MNVQNRPNIYTINDAPPSYAEATGSVPSPYNPHFEPYVTVSQTPSAPFPNPSNYHRDTAPVQSAYPRYGSAEWQNQPTTILSNRPFRGTNEFKSDTCFWKCFVRIIVAAIILACGIGVYLIVRKL
ncbi:uncharacterized protein LOC105201874 [Solenopsis invicta]|uniref:uncharacterized protein LOC105201874 n=1 Tax=Solenopsis invicta TaxID=13686 RepID=UPI0005959A11|nr:uncharacterized protein LOC105201874 [Solenopsis invicta]XP_011168442.1 uncharacterized protein LOC105201874 [Solenopsis invicta]XP_039309267.1 uncharacterized protein LOC105201874 [Solenopsis invicta]XP_039309268.1 uncharacterized protein LOC105201874 [Solenopsis invicta]